MDIYLNPRQWILTQRLFAHSLGHRTYQQLWVGTKSCGEPGVAMGVSGWEIMGITVC